MSLRSIVRVAVAGLFLACLPVGEAAADQCSDAGGTTINGECWIASPDNGTKGRDLCGYPAGYDGAYYSLSGTASAEGCQDPNGNHTSFANACPDVTGNAPDQGGCPVRC